ncbi:MAG: DNA polymerase III subunit gamma/tau [Planctomycetota bacterium]|jgi:DNA polymerase-3 subunit gamma/tau
MAYTVLARKYRSQGFDDVVGQDAISQTLKNAIKSGRIHHAYLFSGTRGVGKTTMARILAKALNCLESDGPTTEPCCKCDSCVAVNAGDDIDVIEIDGASNNGVEEVRRLRENAIYRPARCRYKIYIIDEVHMLTNQAFNALLKILEEPPDHVKFIFATTEPNKVIPTIQSRCQRYDFGNIRANLIADQMRFVLKKEKLKFEDDVVLPIAKMANGSMRDGLSLLDRLISTGVEPLTVDLLEEFLGCPNSEKVYELIGRIGDSDAAGTLSGVEDLISSGLSEVQVVDSVIEYMRDLMVVKSTGVDSELLVLSAEQRKRSAELAEKFDIAGLVYNITSLEKVRWSVKNTDTPRALLDALLIRFALSEHFLNVDDLLGQIKSGGSSKKKQILSSKPAISKVDSSSVSGEGKIQALEGLGDLASIKDKWPRLVEIVRQKLGPSTSSLLGFAGPVGFEGGVLRIEFATSSKAQKTMCESNGRIEQIESVLSGAFGKSLKLQLEIAAENDQDAKNKAPNRNELINDPAVKTVILGLDATVTGIEED